MEYLLLILSIVGIVVIGSIAWYADKKKNEK
jgi:LPXTG-motif cell wall-anchored protein